MKMVVVIPLESLCLGKGEYAKFSGVKIDGSVVDDSNYTAAEITTEDEIEITSESPTDAQDNKTSDVPPKGDILTELLLYLKEAVALNLKKLLMRRFNFCL